MNQPKFKFRDKVKSLFKYEDKVFEVEIIRNNKGDFQYGTLGDGVYLYNEKELELYQEPQKKKLYFWISDASNAVKIFGEKGSPEEAPLGYSFYGELELKEENLK